MNLPNKLTVLRVILAPILLIVMMIDFKFNMGLSLLIFIIASLTDLFDGKIARKRNLITTFGKFLDPIADKLLVFAAFIGLWKTGAVIGMEWIIFIAIVRELLVASARMLAATDGNVIAADIFGKLKTVAQMTAIIAVMFFEQLKALFAFPDVPDVFVSVLNITGSVLMWITAVLTVFSGLNYLKGCKKYILESM